MPTKAEDFKLYSDPDGLMALKPGSKRSPSTDNSMLFTAEKLCIIGETEKGEALRFKKHIMSCMTKDRGFIRHPNLKNPSAYDDLLGAFAFLKVYGYIKEARALKAYMDARRWHNLNNPLWRIPHLVPFASLCAGVGFDIFGTAAIVGAFLHNKGEKKAETSGKCMLRLMACVTPGCGAILRDVTNDWKKHIMMMYGPNGMKEVYKIYFGKDHPLTRWSKTW